MSHDPAANYRDFDMSVTRSAALPRLESPHGRYRRTFEPRNATLSTTESTIRTSISSMSQEHRRCTRPPRRLCHHTRPHRARHIDGRDGCRDLRRRGRLGRVVGPRAVAVEGTHNAAERGVRRSQGVGQGRVSACACTLGSSGGLAGTAAHRSPMTAEVKVDHAELHPAELPLRGLRLP